MKNYLWLIAAALTTSGLFAEEPATINRAKVNVRGGPSFASEVIGQLQKGDPVTFIEEVVIEKPKAGEPSKWAAIKLPEKTAVWVFSEYLNDKTVKVPRLNLRAGPGENYSVVGRLQRGDAVKEIRSVEGWMQIETPENARAYVDANYVTRANMPATVAAAPNPAPEAIKVFEPKSEPIVTNTPPPATVATKPAETVAPPATTTAVVETPKPVETAQPQPQPAETVKPAEVAKVEESPKTEPAKPEEAKPQPQSAAVETPKPAEATTTTPANTAPITPLPTAAPATTTTPPPAAPEAARVLPSVADPIQVSTNVVLTKRLVRREGEVRSTKFNIQAPTYFELVNEGRIINYLSGDKAGVKVKDYKGLRVVVTGEESIDRRYIERPLLEIETIEVAP